MKTAIPWILGRYRAEPTKNMSQLSIRVSPQTEIS